MKGLHNRFAKSAILSFILILVVSNFLPLKSYFLANALLFAILIGLFFRFDIFRSVGLRLITICLIFSSIIVYVANEDPGLTLYKNGSHPELNYEGKNPYYFMHSGDGYQSLITLKTRWYERIGLTEKTVRLRTTYFQDTLDPVDGVLYEVKCDGEVVASGYNNPYEKGAAYWSTLLVNSNCSNLSILVLAGENNYWDHVSLTPPEYTFASFMSKTGIMFIFLSIFYFFVGILKYFSNLANYLSIKYNNTAIRFSAEMLVGVKFSLLSFLISSTILSLIILGDAPSVFYYDSSHYWHVSTVFDTYGSEFYKHYSDYTTIRGYVFPFMLFIFKKLSIFGIDSRTSYHICSILFFSFVFTIILPRILKKEFNAKIHIFSLIIFLLMISYFWKGLLIYPLTDLYSVSFLLIILFFVLKCIHNKSFNAIVSYSFLIGMLTYCAYNIRTVNIFAVFIVVFIFILNNNSFRVLICSLLFFIFGFLLISSPQILINYERNKVLSPFVDTSDTGNGNLYMAQLQYGVYTQRHESFIGDPAISNPAVQFPDPAGRALIDKDYRIKSSRGSAAFLMAIVYNFLDFSGLYGRHVVSLTYNKYPEVYISDLHRKDGILFLINYLVWFVAIFYFVISRQQTHTYHDALKDNFIQQFKHLKSWFFSYGIYLSILVLPAIFAIPGAVEPRFFMPIYILFYIYVCFIVNYTSLYSFFKKKPITVLVLFFIFIVIMAAINGATLGMLPNKPSLL